MPHFLEIEPHKPPCKPLPLLYQNYLFSISFTSYFNQIDMKNMLYTFFFLFINKCIKCGLTMLLGRWFSWAVRGQRKLILITRFPVTSDDTVLTQKQHIVWCGLFANRLFFHMDVLLQTNLDRWSRSLFWSN